MVLIAVGEMVRGIVMDRYKLVPVVWGYKKGSLWEAPRLPLSIMYPSLVLLETQLDYMKSSMDHRVSYP